MAGLAALVGSAAAKVSQPGRAEAANGEALTTGAFASPSTVNDFTGIFSPSDTQLNKVLFESDNSSDSFIVPPSTAPTLPSHPAPTPKPGPTRWAWPE